MDHDIINGEVKEKSIPEDHSVKIIVGYHKPAVLFKSSILVPLHLGRTVALEAHKDGQCNKQEHQWMLDNMIGDDTGDNVSHLNRELCELTGIYWAWKNYDKLGNPDYIGFMHYRRVFAFHETKDTPVSYIPSVEGYIKEVEGALKKYLGTYDLIVPKPEDVQLCKHRNIYHHYSLYPIHYNNGLKIAGEVINELFPELATDFESYLNQSNAYFATMFITSRESFFSYCRILFGVIFAFLKRIDTRNASIMNRRAAAFIGEYLTGAYLFHIKKSKEVLEVPRYIFIDTEPVQPICQVFSENTVPIVFACSDTYAPLLRVCLTSLLQNASPLYNYDILILIDKISPIHKNQLSALAKENVSIRYIKIDPYMAGTDRGIFYLHPPHTISTYYRFFIPNIFSGYSKILYMDPDTIVKGDIAELYKEEIADYWIGAAADIGMVCNINDKTQKTKEIIQNTLLMDDPYKYFQGGVMLMNLKELRENKFTEHCIECLKRAKQLRFLDQDIINSVCYKHVKFIDSRWNVIWHLPFFIKLYERLLPQATYLKYLDDRKNPSIIHFAGPKPWNVLNQEFSDVFWSYCRQTPCYEEFLDRMWRSGIPQCTRGLENKINELGERINKLANELPRVPAPPPSGGVQPKSNPEQSRLGAPATSPSGGTQPKPNPGQARSGTPAPLPSGGVPPKSNPAQTRSDASAASPSEGAQVKSRGKKRILKKVLDFITVAKWRKRNKREKSKK